MTSSTMTTMSSPACGRAPCVRGDARGRLEKAHGQRLGATAALDDAELDPGTVLQRGHTLGQGAGGHEDVAALGGVVGGHESEALLGVVELHLASRHAAPLSSLRMGPECGARTSGLTPTGYPGRAGRVHTIPVDERKGVGRSRSLLGECCGDRRDRPQQGEPAPVLVRSPHARSLVAVHGGRADARTRTDPAVHRHLHQRGPRHRPRHGRHPARPHRRRRPPRHRPGRCAHRPDRRPTDAHRRHHVPARRCVVLAFATPSRCRRGVRLLGINFGVAAGVQHPHRLGRSGRCASSIRVTSPSSTSASARRCGRRPVRRRREPRTFT